MFLEGASCVNISYTKSIILHQTVSNALFDMEDLRCSSDHTRERKYPAKCICEI